MTFPDFLVDKRLLDRNLKKGLVSRKDLEKHISDLPDRTDNAGSMAMDALEADTDTDAELDSELDAEDTATE